VWAIAVASNGDVYAAGGFSTAGGVSAASIAKWDGSSWSTLGGGLPPGNSYVKALASVGTDIYVGGNFATVDGNLGASGIARWNGSSWSTLGSGVDGQVLALAASPDQQALYVGGSFATAGGVSSSNAAMWNLNSQTWSALGDGVGNGAVLALAVSADGNAVYTGGQFATAGGVNTANLAQWNVSNHSWSPVGSGAGITGDGVSRVFALAVAGGNLYVGGQFTMADAASVPNLAQWDGSTWSPLGSCVNVGIVALAAHGNNLYLGGGITTVDGIPSPNIAHWNIVATSGSLQVNIEPASNPDLGVAQWTLDSDSAVHDSGEIVPGLIIGSSHTVHFTGVQNYLTPADQVVVIDAANPTLVTGTYNPGTLTTGSLAVIIGEPDAISAGAKWSILEVAPTTLHISGESVPGLAEGTYIHRALHHRPGLDRPSR